MAYPGSRSHAWVAGERVDHDVLNEWASKNAAWGIVAAPVLKTSAQTSITSIVDVSGLSITFTADASRQYVAVANLYVADTGGNNQDVGTVTIANGSNTVQATAQAAAGVQSEATMVTAIAPFQSTGSTTIKVRLARKTGTGTWQAYGDASGNPSLFYILDAGPATP